MKAYKITVITNARYEYSSELFESNSEDKIKIIAEFASKYGVMGTGLTFSVLAPIKGTGKFVFVPTEAVSSIEIEEWTNSYHA